MSFDWKGALKTVAPALATALGGPLAGVAVKSISDSVLGKPDGSEDEIAQAIQSGGADALLKLKQAEQQFILDMKKLDVDIEKLHADDRANAREREVKTGDKTPAILAGVITIGFFGILGYMLKYGTPEHGGEALLILLGALGAAWGSVVQYYYGSSAGSARKDELMRKK